MLKRFKLSFLNIILMLLSFFGATFTTFAWWFADNNIISNVTGNTPPSYFAFGDGSEDSPYGITSPVHLYNLAWLQYLGTFNNPTDQKQYHFVLDKDIDMKGLTLPPIGTTDNPFIGTFDGGNHLISNLTVSNKLGEDDISKYPSGITSLTGVDIVGMFGVVGNYNDVINYEYNKAIIDIHDLFLDKVTISSSSNNSLIGILAGYVNEGNVSNIDICYSKINAGKNVSPISNYENISKYSIIGDYNDVNINWVDKPEEEPEDGGWGNSLDMRLLSKRLNYMFTESETKTALGNGSHSTYNTNLIWSQAYAGNYTYETNGLNIDLYKNTYIPLSVDKEASELVDESTEFSKKITYSSSSFTSVSNTYYSTHSEELVSPSNTGYIVGGATSAKGTYLRTKTTYRGMLAASYGSSDTSKNFDPGENYNSIDMLAFQNGNLRAIGDQYNQNKESTSIGSSRVPVEEFNFHNYDKVREDLGNLLKEQSIFGLRFYKGSSARFDLTTDNSIYGNVKLNNKTYNNYQLLDSSIMFNVASGGYLTLIAAGIHQANTQNYSLFNIYKIDRDWSTYEVKSITKIENIYKDTSGRFYYNQNSTPANSTLVFKAGWMGKVQIKTALLYMEIPLFSDTYPAEFALGGCIESNAPSDGAYLMYLDLGASGDIGAPPVQEEVATIESIKFIDSIPSDRSHPDALSILFKLSKEQTTTLVNIYFKRDSNELMFYYVDPSNGLNVTVIADLGIGVQINNTITF